ncbi:MULTISPECIES: PDDEXK-like family protein [unclassified Rhizobium]|uniref:PDDEXK-like family protein n=1 Tax=unclassified Rhizobium TaxID=2613769 RepID=UPI0007EB7588|nr:MULTISPECIES: PD-(D/E)XK nuclease family protein [unclassified Rhizobium]ANK91544.1 PDDEXK nuclease superfamily protein [Rhizobium sp. N6212]ANK97577.1 PDDEXK nuclease superfamily protein [Rhizobium sp. N621]
MSDNYVENFQSLSDFITDFTQMLPRLAATREGIDLYGATTFSPFSIFNPDENTLSRVIAELFDPSGSHGQGLLFLNALLAAIRIPRLNRLDTVKVRREVMTRAKRRIDIVIETPRYVIGIENKPWAAQQKNQLGDYLGELKADLRGRQPVLIFLSEQAAQTAGDETIRVPYHQAQENEATLHSVLAGVVSEIKANAPKIFVEDFLRYIEINFGGEYVDTPADKPFTDAVSAEFDNPQRRKAIASVLLSHEMLHIRILDEIGEYLLAEVRAKVGEDFEASCPFPDIDPKVSDCLWQKWTPYGLRTPSWPANCHVAIEAETDWVNGIIFGVRCPDGSKLPEKYKHYASPGRTTLGNMVSSIPGGRQTNYWPWYKNLAERYWGQEFCARLVIESPTGAVKDHPEIQDLARQFVEMATEVDRLLKASQA